MKVKKCYLHYYVTSVIYAKLSVTLIACFWSILHVELINLNQQKWYYYSSLHCEISMFYIVETWILYRGKEHGVSKVVRDAYKSYEDIEFKTTAFEKLINDVDRHVKLIRIAGEKVIPNN